MTANTDTRKAHYVADAFCQQTACGHYAPMHPARGLKTTGYAAAVTCLKCLAAMGHPAPAAAAAAITERTTERVTTHELREGDVLRADGLRVRLGAVKQTRHEVTERGGATYYASGEILNPEYLQTDAGRYLYGGIIALDGSDTWPIQGNGLATWLREVDPETAARRAAINERIDATIEGWVADR